MWPMATIQYTVVPCACASRRVATRCLFEGRCVVGRGRKFSVVGDLFMNDTP